MAWPTKNITWPLGAEPTREEDLLCDANTLFYEGMLASFNAGSTPANCVRPLVAADAFAGVVRRAADNRSPVIQDILHFPNYGDGTTGAGGATVRLLTQGRIRLIKSVTPDNAGVQGNGITGAAGTKADINTKVYSNGQGFTFTAGGNTQVGVVADVGTTNSGGTYWDIELQTAVMRNS